MSQTIAAVAGHEPNISQARTSFWGLTLGSIGVVYGDIGTSPLYAVRELVLRLWGRMRRQVNPWCSASCR